jgi:hypothetical protein
MTYREFIESCNHNIELQSEKFDTLIQMKESVDGGIEESIGAMYIEAVLNDIDFGIFAESANNAILEYSNDNALITESIGESFKTLIDEIIKKVKAVIEGLLKFATGSVFVDSNYPKYIELVSNASIPDIAKDGANNEVFEKINKLATNLKATRDNLKSATSKPANVIELPVSKYAGLEKKVQTKLESIKSYQNEIEDEAELANLKAFVSTLNSTVSVGILNKNGVKGTINNKFTSSKKTDKLDIELSKLRNSNVDPKPTEDEAKLLAEYQALQNKKSLNKKEQKRLAEIEPAVTEIVNKYNELKKSNEDEKASNIEKLQKKINDRKYGKGISGKVNFKESVDDTDFDTDEAGLSSLLDSLV